MNKLKYMKIFHYLCIVCVIILGLITIVGSGGGGLFSCDDCNDEASNVEASLGSPDDWSLYDSGDNYWSLTYWYWCSGISYTFTQDGCDCDVSTYQFDPICY